jgi:trans-2,3-dihydro-3-hydroxyanthranilate isomerase
MLRLPFTWVDVFAPARLAGNQLAVFTAPPDLPEPVMCRITREMSHSETAFLQPTDVAGASARVRIFIPTQAGAREVPFAGHPVLGSACVAAMAAEPGLVHMETGVGVLPVAVTLLEPDLWAARMSQPVPRVVRVLPGAAEERAALAEALGLDPADLRADLPVEAVENGMQTVIVPLGSVIAVQRAVPDLARLRALLGRAGLCTLVFAPGGMEAGTDVHCRVFSPFDLVAEDPATGSANGPLGEYLVRHGLVHGDTVHSEQGYMIGRPSLLTVTVERVGGATRAVHVGGRVFVIGRGEFCV